MRRARRTSIKGQRAFDTGDLSVAEHRFTSALKRVAGKVAKDPAAVAIAAEANLGIGRICLVRNDLHAATFRFDQVRQLMPAAWQGFYWAGCAAGHGANFPRAEWFFNATLAREPKLGKAYLQRAQVRLWLGRDDLALHDLYSAAQHRALDERGRLLTAAVLLRRGHWQQAESFAAGLDSPDAAAILGTVAWRRGDVDTAFTAYERALASGSRHDGVLFYHGLAGYRLGRFSASIDSWTALLGRHPNHRTLGELVATAHRARAAARLAGDDIPGTIEDLDSARRNRPSGPFDAAIPELYLHAAAQALAANEHDRARVHLTASNHPKATHYLALLSYAGGNHSAAERAWRQILDTAPTDPRARYGLAICTLHSNELAEEELRDLAKNGAPQRIRQAAGHALAAVLIRRGDWPDACDVLAPLAEDPWRTSVFAECLYRAGREAELLALPDNPWRRALRAWSGEVGDAAPGGRPGRELALALHAAAVTAAERGDWTQAAALLKHGPADRELELIEALAYGLSGQHHHAIGLLSRATERDPTNHRLGHTLAVMLLHLLSAEPAQDAATWQSCISVWMSVLHDQSFWERWRADAQRRYGCPILPGMIDSLRTSVRELIERRVVGHSDDGEPLLLLRREHEAARLLGELGGLPLPPSKTTRLVCGPLRIAELGLHRELGEFAAELHSMNGDAGLMFRMFSQAGLADVQLSAGRAAEAAQLALDLRCPSCRRDKQQTAAGEPKLCASACPAFDRYNPAFAALDDKYGELSECGVALAVDALLRLAMAEIAKADMDVTKARRSWAKAVRYASQLGEEDENMVLREVVDAALGRSEALARKKNWTGAINVLDAALTVVGNSDDAERERVCAALADKLTTRAAVTFNKDRSNAEPAREDLSRAVTLAPHKIRSTLSHGVVLWMMALDQETADVVKAVRLLSKALQEFERGLVDRPSHPELIEYRDRARRDLNRIAIELLGRRW